MLCKCHMNYRNWDFLIKLIIWEGLINVNLILTEIQVMDLFELNDHIYNDNPDVPFLEVQLKESISLTKAPFFDSDQNQNSLSGVFLKYLDMVVQHYLINYRTIQAFVWLALMNIEIIVFMMKILQQKDMNFSLKNNNRRGRIPFMMFNLGIYIKVFKSVIYSKFLKDLRQQREVIKVLNKIKGISGNSLIEGTLKDKDDPKIQQIIRYLNIKTKKNIQLLLLEWS